MRQCWPRDVDGLLGDWPDPCWVDLELIYSGDPCDINSAKYSPCWDPCNDMVYSVVVVEDADHVFETAPSSRNSSDRIEVYVQGDPNGGDQWGSEASEHYDKAQQYVVGYQNIAPGFAWALVGDGIICPLDPGDPWACGPEFEHAARVSGSKITYEIGASIYIWFGGLTTPIGSVADEIRQLGPGIQIGFDVVVGSRWGSAPHDDEEYGRLSANLKMDKHIYAESFQRWELRDYDGTVVPPECGDWGYVTGDIHPTRDCYVDMGDFTELSLGWLACSDPDPPCSFEW